MFKSRSWKIIDKRTGVRVSSASFLTEESAWHHITQWQDRHDRGGRPDIKRDLLVNMLPVAEEHHHG